MIIKNLEIGDIKEATTLIWKVFSEFEAPEYSEEGIKEFKDFIESDIIVKKVLDGNSKFYGAIEEGKIIGVAATRDINHIMFLFVDKNYHKKGIATKLLNKLIGELLKEGNIKEVTVNSSPYGVGFYHKFGFKDLMEEQCLNGIRFTPMKMEI